MKANACSFKWCIVCLSKISLDKATRQRSELLDHPSYNGLVTLFSWFASTIVRRCFLVGFDSIIVRSPCIVGFVLKLFDQSIQLIDHLV